MPDETDDPAGTRMGRDVCYLVHRAAHHLEVQARSVGEDVGLSAPQVVALRELGTPITPRELAGRMFCEPSNVTFVLDRLEHNGLVERRPHPTDRRAKQIVLTAAGEHRRTDVVRLLAARSPLTALSDDQQRQLLELLEAFGDHAPR